MGAEVQAPQMPPLGALAHAAPGPRLAECAPHPPPGAGRAPPEAPHVPAGCGLAALNAPLLEAPGPRAGWGASPHTRWPPAHSPAFPRRWFHTGAAAGTDAGPKQEARSQQGLRERRRVTGRNSASAGRGGHSGGRPGPCVGTGPAPSTSERAAQVQPRLPWALPTHSFRRCLPVRFLDAFLVQEMATAALTQAGHTPTSPHP